MAQHKFYVADLKENDYSKLPDDVRNKINKELQKLFYRLLKNPPK
jgi:hypothetical protein